MSPPRPIRFAVDTREPWPHPWAVHWSKGVTPVRIKLETGDVALLALPEAAVIERKTTADLFGCLGGQRERFVRELERSRHLGAFAVVVEGDLPGLLAYARGRGGGMSEASILGTLAAWTRRFSCPFFFAGTVPLAAEFAERFLLSQIRESERTAKALAREEACAAAP